MKNKIKILGLLAGVIVILISCKEDTLTLYSDENNIYFPNQWFERDIYNAEVSLTAENGITYSSPKLISTAKPNEAQDTLNYSASNSSIVVIPVRMMGLISDQKREFKCRAITKNVPGVAVEGRDFQILESFIKPKSYDGGIIVELFTEKMDEDDVLTIEFELLPNENFQTNFTTVNRKANSDDLVSTTNITLRYTTIALQPGFYDTYWATTIGPWSIKKLQVLTTYLNFDTSLLTVAGPDIYTLISYGMALRIWLEDYERENGTPYMEKDGVTPMEVGTFVKALY